MPKEEGNEAAAESAMARRTSRLPLDDGPVDSRLGSVPESREGLVAEIPEAVLGTASCVRADEDSQESSEWTRPGCAPDE